VNYLRHVTAENCIGAVFSTMSHAVMAAISSYHNFGPQGFDVVQHFLLVLFPVYYNGWKEDFL